MKNLIYVSLFTVAVFSPGTTLAWCGNGSHSDEFTQIWHESWQGLSYQQDVSCKKNDDCIVVSVSCGGTSLEIPTYLQNSEVTAVAGGRFCSRIFGADTKATIYSTGRCVKRVCRNL